MNLVTLAMNDGLYNMTEWYIGLIEYSYSNPYRQIIDDSVRDESYDYYNETCLPALEICYNTDDNDDCYSADRLCKRLLSNIQVESSFDFEQYDIRENAVIAPNTYEDYLSRQDVKDAIGARGDFVPLSSDVYNNLTSAGDCMLLFTQLSPLPSMLVILSSFSGSLIRSDHSIVLISPVLRYANDEHGLTTHVGVRPSAALIPSVLAAGVKVLMWTGDADWICSWEANSREADAVVWPGQAEFQGKTLEPYTVDGTERGTFKNVDNFSYMRVYGAGHDMSFYRK